MQPENSPLASGLKIISPRTALASIIALGLCLRLYGLTAYGVWFDEAYHIQLVQLPDVPTMLEAVLSNPPSAPLYVLLLRGWAGIFGHGDLAVRMLSVLLGTATIPAAYRLGKVMASRTVGLWGALLIAVSPYAVEFSQEAALYALASLATTVALAAGWHWRTTGSGLPFYIISGTVAIYSHYVVAVILAMFAALGLLRGRYGRQQASGVKRRLWLLANGAVFLLWSPWLITMLIYWASSPQPRAALPDTATTGKVVGALIQFSSGTASLQQGEWALALTSLLPGGALLLAGLYAARKQEALGLGIIGLISALLFFLPALASALTGLWLFVPHFMLFLLPSMLVILSMGLAPSEITSPSGITNYELRITSPSGITHYLASRLRSRLPVAGLHILLGVWLVAQVWGLALFYRYPPHGADGLRELATVLRTSSRAGDKVFVTPPVLTPTLRQYYSGTLRGLPVDFDLRAVYLPYFAGGWYRQSVAVLDAAAANLQRFWLVYRPELDDGGRLLEYVSSRYKVVSRRDYSYADLYLVERP